MATLESIWQDVRYAFRGLRRSPAFAATVIATLGLGIGANAAMFDVVDRLMFRPLAYLRDPGAVRRIYWQSDYRGTTRTTQTTYYTRYLDLGRWTHSFSQLAAFSERNLAIGDGELARERRVGAVSASFFQFFDARWRDQLQCDAAHARAGRARGVGRATERRRPDGGAPGRPIRDRRGRLRRRSRADVWSLVTAASVSAVGE